MRDWDRYLAALMAVLLAMNGAVMMAGPAFWYGAVPGVPATGPFNRHFIMDIGAAYLTFAAALAWFAWRPAQGWPALAAAACWLVIHAAIHVRDAACGATPLADLARDFVGVYLFAAIPLALVLLRKPATSGVNHA
jgi:hypothetical protein